MQNTLLPELNNSLNIEVQDNFNCYIDESNPQTIVIEYKSIFKDAYVKPSIKLEIGSLSSLEPAKLNKISPYVAQYYPQLFEMPDTYVLCILPERTFWEKITILHKEANKSDDKNITDRYSRHYYDVYCMTKSKIKLMALKNIALLKDVIKFKSQFYKCKYAKYEKAYPGSINLIPSKKHIKQLEQDYSKMKNMLFGNKKPEFNEILNDIKLLETEINSLK